MVNNAEFIIDNCDVIIINNKENEFIELLNKPTDKIIIDFVRLNDEIRNYPNYFGINW